jgi:uncharacterized protein (DUF952 family)
MTETHELEVAAGSIYHLSTRAEWEKAQAIGVYARSTRDKAIEDVGFIHCSLPSQLAEVAEFIYYDCEEALVVLVMDLPNLEASGLPVRFEDGGNGKLYPHIYGSLPCHLVADVLPASVDEQGRFIFPG